MDLFDTNTTFERQLFAKAARNRIPLYGVLELLPLCNLNCDMCYVHLSKQEMQSQGGLRSVDEWISFAHQMKDAGTLFLLLTGGEPLLFPQFKELYCALKDMGMILTLNTNGTLINEEWAEFFAKNKPRRINITLYGSKNETYENLCHMKDGFDKTIRGIELLKKYKIDVKINGSLVKKNFHDRMEIIDIGEKYDIPVRIDTYMYPSVRERTTPFNFQARLEPKEAIVLDNPRIPRSFLEAARTVRRRIERAQKETGMKSFLVTSAMPGEGKSTVSANIAISLAMKGYKVILVDADLRNPSTAKVLGMNEQELGTLEVMKGEVNIDDAVQQYKNTSVKVLAGSTPIQDTSTVLSGKNMRQFVKELEAEADFVIIDTPPSGLLSDAAIVAQYVDGAVFVIRQDYTDVDRILEGMEILSGSGAEITGCILNDVNVRTSESQHYMNSYRTKGETL